LLLAGWLLGQGASAHAAAEVLVVGDSWGFLTAPALAQVLLDNRHPGVGVVNASVPGETADDLSKPPGLQSIGDALAAHPDVVVVHLSIGGNDFLGGWTASLTAAQEDMLFDAIVADVQTIAQHVLTLRPDVLLLQPSYDYPRRLPNGTPLEVNTAAEELSSRMQTLAGSTAGMTFENLNGLMQLHFGLPDLGLPPFDPSLPRIDQPSPAEAFVDAIHLTAGGYVIFSQELYDRFYAGVLPPPPVPALPFPAALLLAVLLLMSAASRWRAAAHHAPGGST
jgi:lysophospholipase L1-like esterase